MVIVLYYNFVESVQWLILTFAWPGVVQVQFVPSLSALQAAFGGKELTRRVIRFVVCPTNLKCNMNGIKRMQGEKNSSVH